MKTTRSGLLLAVCLLLLGTTATTPVWGADNITLTDRLPLTKTDIASQALHATEGPQPRSSLDMTALDFEALIREIYTRFEDSTRASGLNIRFRISDVRTFQKSEWDEVPWLGLYTVPTGDIIETQPHVRQGALPSLSVVHFQSGWSPVDSTYTLDQSFSEVVGGMTAADVMRELIDWKPERARGITTLSSFQVQVSFEGKERSYRALVLWQPLAAELLLFSLADHIVPGVADTFHESRPIVTREVIEDFGPAEGHHEKNHCLEFAYDVDGPHLQRGPLTQGHSSGFHFSALHIQFICQSFSTCASTCSPLPLNNSCGETGSTGLIFWHKKGTSVQASSKGGASGNPSECGYALGCAVKECLFGIFCSNISFETSGFGASIKLSAGLGTVLSDMSLTSGQICSGATQAPHDPGPLDPCGNTTNFVTVMDVDNGGGAKGFASEAIHLDRLEPSSVIHDGEAVSYLMAEWALIDYPADVHESGFGVAILSASSDKFGQESLDSLATTMALSGKNDRGSDRRTALVVALPPHEPNSRAIPMPEFQLARQSLPVKAHPGRVLIRADFSEDHHLQELEFLYASTGGVSHELALNIEESISLKRLTAEEHRVVVFALLEVGETIRVVDQIRYLPRCCCGDEFCL